MTDPHLDPTTGPRDDGLAYVPQPGDRPPPSTASGRAMRRKPSLSGRIFRWWLAIAFLLALGAAACLAFGVGELHGGPLHITLEGSDLADGITIHGLSADGQAALSMAALLVAVLLLVLLPLILALVLALVACALVLALAAPLFGLAVALVVLTSPLWLVALCVWLVARSRRPPPPHSATIAA
ncbi:MAG TPA: hypothetical protein VF453_12715 [Burkholderiaceae bacterium]